MSSHSMKGYLIMVYICISLMADNIELFHVFIGHLCILFGGVYLQIFCLFLVRFFVLYYLVVRAVYIF